MSKQLLPIYDKPMIYYPLSVLMLAGIREIMIITTPHDLDQFERTLGDGSQWGISLSYMVQPSPDGLAQAFILAEDFLDGAPSAMVLGDNIFFGQGLPLLLEEADKASAGATVFGYRVADPERYGVADFDADGTVRAIIEKPPEPPSNYAVTGLYFVDGKRPRARPVRSRLPSGGSWRSPRCSRATSTTVHSPSSAWAAATRGWIQGPTPRCWTRATSFAPLTERQGQQVGSPDEIAFELGGSPASSFSSVPSASARTSTARP